MLKEAGPSRDGYRFSHEVRPDNQIMGAGGANDVIPLAPLPGFLRRRGMSLHSNKPRRKISNFY